MRFSLVKLVPRNIFHGRIFDDVVLSFYFAIRRLGHEVEFINNRLDSSSRNLIFGANIKPDQDWLWQKGPERVIVNLEQFRLSGGGWAENEPYLNLLRSSKVWDYSESNVRFLESQGVDVSFFSLGYVPEMTRLSVNRNEKDEVLFYGGVNERRLKIITALQKAGIKVRCLENEYGLSRDQAIYEAGLLLNIHRGVGANLEMARLAYLLANRKAIASEFNDDTERYEGLEEACAFHAYDNLAAGVIELMADKERRRRQAERGFEQFSRISLADSLERIVGRGPGYSAAPARITGPQPKLLNAGSGDRFINEALNVDIDETRRPDLVIDLSRPIEARTVETQRFGTVELTPRSFSTILVRGLLERVANPRQAMLNFIELLEDGGRLEIIAAYHSSNFMGNPDILRGYNETLAGWCAAITHESRSPLVKSTDYILSGYGLRLKGMGLRREHLTRRAGAVDAIRLEMVMGPSAPPQGRAIFSGPVEEWLTPVDDLNRPDPPDIRLESSLGLKFILLRQHLKRLRYKFILKRAKGLKKFNYQRKLAALDREIEYLLEILRLTSGT
ncbi:hypothetical protein C4J81_07995 [Deltaproteobacteria bacterium Smac51]|nr:hypothetical protein C4J81_07995 [Deltaproteobacteria bacterium Smac51]